MLIQSGSVLPITKQMEGGQEVPPSQLCLNLDPQSTFECSCASLRSLPFDWLLKLVGRHSRPVHAWNFLLFTAERFLYSIGETLCNCCETTSRLKSAVSPNKKAAQAANEVEIRSYHHAMMFRRGGVTVTQELPPNQLIPLKRMAVHKILLLCVLAFPV